MRSPPYLFLSRSAIHFFLLMFLYSTCSWFYLIHKFLWFVILSSSSLIPILMSVEFGLVWITRKHARTHTHTHAQRTILKPSVMSLHVASTWVYEDCCTNCILCSEDRDSVLLWGFGNCLQDCTVSKLRRTRRESSPPWTCHMTDSQTHIEIHRDTQRHIETHRVT